jgi:hypothetical protein
MPDLQTTANLASGNLAALARAQAQPVAIPASAISVIRLVLEPPATSAEIRATVQSQDNHGVTQVKTDAGTITLQTAARLPPGTAVTVRIDASGAEPRIFIIRTADRAPTQDQQRLATAAPAITIEILGSGEPPARIAAPVTIDATRGLIARAVVLSPTQPPEATARSPLANLLGGSASTLSTGSPGASLPISVTPLPALPAALAQVAPGAPPAATLPGHGANPAPTQPPPGLVTDASAGARTALPASLASSSSPSIIPASPGLPSGAPGAGSSGAVAPAAPRAIAQPGTELQVRILGTAALHAVADDAAFTPIGLPRAQSADSALPGTRPVIAQATVEGFLPRGEAVLRTEFARLALQLPAGWAHIRSGDVLALELVAPPPAGQPAPPPPLAAPDRGVSGLRGLELAFAAAQMPAEAIGLPRPGPKLARQLMSFAQAARSGSIEPIFGSMEPIQSGGEAVKSLATRAAAELRESANPAEQPRDWKLIVMPLMTEAGMVPLRFFSRKQVQSNPRAKAEDASRFVIECDHKALGAVAIDGLVHGRRIDVVVKTEASIDIEAQRDLLALFDDALGAMGFAGELRFNGNAPVSRIPLSPTAEQRLGLTA